MGSILLKNILHDESLCQILVEGNRISRILPAGAVVEVPEGAEVVDCTAHGKG